MVWFIFNIEGAFRVPLLHGVLADERGLWAGIITLFVAIFVLGGFLLAFLIRSARGSDQTEAGPDGFHGQEGP